MVITMLEQTMRMRYICIREYILINIQYNQISLSALNKYILLKRQQLVPLYMKFIYIYL